MKITQTNRKTTQTNITPTLWHELDDRTSETMSGGAEGCLAWSIRFGDVRRSQSSETPIVFVIL